MAEAMGEVFTEVVVAPDFDESALSVLQQEEECAVAPVRREFTQVLVIEMRPVSGGLLLQTSTTCEAEGDDPDELDAGRRPGSR